MSTPNPYADTTPTSPRAGRAALWAAIIAVVVSLAQQVFVQFTPIIMRSLEIDGSQVGLLFAPFTIVILGLSIAALVLGLMARNTPGQQVAAGVGIGIGAAHIAAIVVSLVAPLAIGVLY